MLKVTNIDFFTQKSSLPTYPILGQLKWESLKKRRKDNRLILLYKGLKGKAKRVHTITKKHYIPESTFNYQKALRKHMQGGICKLLFYVF